MTNERQGARRDLPSPGASVRSAAPSDRTSGATPLANDDLRASVNGGEQHPEGRHVRGNGDADNGALAPAGQGNSTSTPAVRDLQDDFYGTTDELYAERYGE